MCKANLGLLTMLAAWFSKKEESYDCIQANQQLPCSSCKPPINVLALPSDANSHTIKPCKTKIIGPPPPPKLTAELQVHAREKLQWFTLECWYRKDNILNNIVPHTIYWAQGKVLTNIINSAASCKTGHILRTMVKHYSNLLSHSTVDTMPGSSKPGFPATRREQRQELVTMQRHTLPPPYFLQPTYHPPLFYHHPPYFPHFPLPALLQLFLTSDLNYYSVEKLSLYEEEGDSIEVNGGEQQGTQVHWRFWLLQSVHECLKFVIQPSFRNAMT
ncbi:hypothetical protein SERLADRAFT_404557 [Serpula lacrymans var. lacrymans S7.9]|uniref:Uncharacterized protein n=1 Tax=Serpula lacrymans var. lacrymans (strain S7.9) TaxID=578457 RepID=F8NDR3_SERL9|nr:uncharacterized protein SERLADRAFT_404557 [Serpula lacrymans var. lacrymans S7.9]EGO30347.1 hypothetical protein SERLADRAFT_404557 [Serpula lacrymans var. lacrymans S7.9]